MDQLQKFVVQVSTHSRSFKNGTISMTGEHYWECLASSSVPATCSGCRMEVVFPTSSKVTDLGGGGGGQRWECNLAAVWGQMSTGGGHAPLAETVSVLGVPVLTKKSFMATRRLLVSHGGESLEESMKEAAEEEKRNAIKRGLFHEGVPAIAVIVDGGWSKRTHKHSQSLASALS